MSSFNLPVDQNPGPILLHAELGSCPLGLGPALELDVLVEGPQLVRVPIHPISPKGRDPVEKKGFEILVQRLVARRLILVQDGLVRSA